MPYLLIEDENKQIKKDEMYGKTPYAIKTIPPDVCTEKNAFVNRGSDMFLEHFGIDLSKDNALIVGGSSPELFYFAPKCDSITCIGTCPELVAIYHEETRKEEIKANWVCADGEAIPFDTETFDTIIIRQTFHNLSKYHAAICEFCRVCKRGGRIVIIDEPYVPMDLSAEIVSCLSDDFHVYDDITVGLLRKHYDLWYNCNDAPITRPKKAYDQLLKLIQGRPNPDIKRVHQAPDPDDYEPFLTDKHLNSSLLDCIYSLKYHALDYKILASKETAWVDMDGEKPKFRTAPQPENPIVDQIFKGGWFSILAKKTRPTTQSFFQQLRCPVCISTLTYADIEASNGKLVCESCACLYPVKDGLPYLLIEDENEQIKKDEMYGEAQYVKKTIPLDVQNERNAFANHGSGMCLEHFGIDLSKDNVLVVGGSSPELYYFAPKCNYSTGIDLCPELVAIYHEVTRKEEIKANWACADGEAIPFDTETFDTIIIRQTLHHLLKYHAAICEFFRVCKTGGRIVIIDEPYVPVDFSSDIVSSLSDDFHVYDDITVGLLRKHYDKWHAPTKSRPKKAYDRLLKWAQSKPKLDIKKVYQAPDPNDYESFLTDKYLNFSLLDCIYSLKYHTLDYKILASKEIAWVDMNGEKPKFCTAPQPEITILDQICKGGWVSILARKTRPTTLFRDRSSLMAFAGFNQLV